MVLNTAQSCSQPEFSPVLSDLNDSQRQAVTHVSGPLLVIAGPGSGKTRVITHRIGHLVLGVGIAPWQVLAITFTNKAASEMQQRVAALVSEHQARAMTVCTFHSFCARILRIHGHHAGLIPGFSIYDVADQQRAAKQAIHELEINSANFPPATVLASISNAKNDLIDEIEFAQTASDFFNRTVAKVYTKYQQILKRNQALDFDDLLMRAVRLLTEHPPTLKELQDRYQYILIDEYQDTNHAQFLLANELAKRHRNICATGDPDQSIYGWRGADLRNILEFEDHYHDARVIRLEQNYRSTPQILAAADALIQRNQQRRPKKLWTQNVSGTPVRIMTCSDEHQEAQWVVEQFRELRDTKQLSWRQMAVLYRINSLSRVMEDVFRDQGIPYQIARGTAFYDRAEIKNVVAYLRSIVNPADEVSLFRILNVPTRGIGDRTIKAIRKFVMTNNCSVSEVLTHPDQVTTLGTRARSGLTKFFTVIQSWRRVCNLGAAPLAADRTQPTLRAFVEQILLESGLHQLYKQDKTDPDRERLANLGEFVSFTQQFEDELDNSSEETTMLMHKLLALLERVSLISDVDAVDSEQGAVTLMTMHAAKGLEFGAVAIIGAEDGVIPHSRASTREEDLEEERRLCFVGMTRSEQNLLLSHARFRTVFGNRMSTIPSRFLDELPDEVEREQVETESIWFDETDESRLDALDQATAQAELYPPGTRVRHPQFGLGQIVHIAPVGTHTRARVEFKIGGPRTLILQYAQLEKV